MMADAEDKGEDQEDQDLQSPRIRLMQEVAEQMDAIRDEVGDDFAIGEVITIVQVVQPNGDMHVRVRSLAPYLEALGLLRVAEKILHEKHDAEMES
jgi:hypothetical protein